MFVTVREREGERERERERERENCDRFTQSAGVERRAIDSPNMKTMHVGKIEYNL